MPSAFDECKTETEVNDLYRRLYHEIDAEHNWDLAASLMEAQRQAFIRLVMRRDSTTVREPKPEDVGGQSDRVRPSVLRNWALGKGIAYRRRTIQIENRYRAEHGMDLLPDRTRLMDVGGSTVPVADVRRWAASKGIPIGTRGRLAPAVIAQYTEWTATQAEDA